MQVASHFCVLRPEPWEIFSKRSETKIVALNRQAVNRVDGLRTRTCGQAASRHREVIIVGQTRLSL